jgi:DNA-3-methyladenine glycosylase II
MHIFRYGKPEIDYLTKRDKKLGRAIGEIGVIERNVIPDLFTALVASVSGQQVSAKAVEMAWNRMEDRFGTITPEAIATTTLEEIRQCGMSMRRAGYIKGIGDEVAGGNFDLAGLHSLSDEDVIARLTTLKGIGGWTAEILLIFLMERPDVVRFGDYAIRRGIMRLYGKETLDRAQFWRYRKRYSPCGSVHRSTCGRSRTGRAG